jgi:glutamate dehydrogenase (NAD(P)+)
MQADRESLLDGPPQYRVELRDPDGLRVLLVIDRVIDGLAGGGVRAIQECSFETLTSLASRMTLKFAALGVPLGGAKAAVLSDPREWGADREPLAQAARLLEPFLRTIYLAGEDVGTRGEDIAWLYEQIDLDVLDFVVEHRARRGIDVEIPAGIQASDLLGTSFADVIAGYGVAACIDTAIAETSGRPLDELRVAIQGYGSVGRATAERLAERGVRIAAVADADGALFAPEGLDVQELGAAVDELGTIDRRRLGQSYTALTREDWLTVPVHVLIPAAVEGAISAREAAAIAPSVELVVEAANAAVTPDGEEILAARGVAVLPDFIASAGSAGAFGLLISGQARGENVLDELRRRLQAATRTVLTDATIGAIPRERGRALAASNLRRDLVHT